MRVNELSKELGKSNKEVLEILQKNHFDIKSHSSGITEEQAAVVRRAFAPEKAPAQAAAQRVSESGTGKAETKRVENVKKEPERAEIKETAKAAEGKPADAPRKRIAAVYRPQNSTQMRSGRPAGRGPAGAGAARPAQSAGQAGVGAARPAQPAGQAGVGAARPAQSAGQAGVGAARPAQAAGQAGVGTARPAQSAGQAGVGAARPAQPAGQAGVGAARPAQSAGQAGAGTARPSGQDTREPRYASQGSREGFSGNRDGQREGFSGNRDGQRGGFSGNRDGQRGGFSGNRDGQRGGFSGNRDGQRGGFSGNRDGQRGGFSGGRDGQRGGQGGRGLNIPKPSFDGAVVQKQQNNKQSKNAYKTDRYDKIDHEEELRAKQGRGKGGKAAVVPPQQKKEAAKAEEIKTIILPEVITIKELAEKMKLQPSVIVKKLFLQGKVVTINQEVDYEQAEEIAMEFDVLCEKEEKVDVIEELLKEEEEDEKDMVVRPPVVCVMGHVDHGKTSLLDAIRQTNVTAKEAGGITQHIGAYMVEINGQKITFLDTPGHEAFTAMRMRGAKSTDIAILVVAADDGVMPQTIEAISHAKAAGVEIIVAINKIDKPSANIDKVKQELIEYELVPEDWGGSTIFVPVSAHTKEGIPELLEMILLTAEVKELKANPNRNARGLVIEAELDKGKGPVATVLVQKGTLHVGDPIAAGACYGKVRAMMDDKGRRVKEAGPSTPVEILGLNDVPNAGEVFVSPDSEKEARSFAETFIAEGKNKLLEDTKTKLSLDDLFSQIKAGNVKELPIIVKADVQGSVEAVKQSLLKLSNEEVVVKVIHGGVGAINESDVSLAAASNAIIIGFNVRPDATAKSIAEREKVDVRLYRVIYQAIEDVEAAMKGMLDPVFEEQIIGHAVVRQTFRASGVGTIAGAYVLDGKFQRGCKARITRDGEQLFDGAVASLKRFKDDVKEVNAGYECGLVFEKFNDLQEDDMIEAYAMVEVPR